MHLPVVTSAQMREIEERTITAGVSVETLMEQVGLQIARAIAELSPGPGKAIIYYGKGHNGGDALVAARHLAIAGWHIDLRPQQSDATKLAPLTAKKLNELHALKPTQPPSLLPQPRIILDGLLGIGAAGPLHDDIRKLTRQINSLRVSSNARVIAIDLPTGLNADTGHADPDCVVADITITAGYAKTGLLADTAPAHVGRLCVAPVAQFGLHAPSDFTAETATPVSLHAHLQRRNFDSHKNQFGHIGIIAGSPGFTGAAVLCASGALHGGAGLVTLFAPQDIQPTLAIAAPPEVMVRPVQTYSEVLDEKLDVIALGPGLGKAHAGALLHIIEHAPVPMVVDADGLNMLAQNDVNLLLRCAGPRLLTPHPGEMARLFPESKNLSRLDTATQFTARMSAAAHPITLLLKGSRTIIHQHGLPSSYNTTGNPGMGTGGMGDVLTGVTAALMGQHLAPYNAARLGAWLCGRAAELAITESRDSEESLSAMAVVRNLGPAFTALCAGGC
jgi:hydroxyethylthiazole kinase-like uncharacterized protein yjeF